MSEWLDASLNIHKCERYLALIYYDRVVSCVNTLVGVVFPVVFQVVINRVRLGHFNVFVPFVMGINVFQLCLREMIDNAGSK